MTLPQSKPALVFVCIYAAIVMFIVCGSHAEGGLLVLALIFTFPWGISVFLLASALLGGQTLISHQAFYIATMFVGTAVNAVQLYYLSLKAARKFNKNAERF